MNFKSADPSGNRGGQEYSGISQGKDHGRKCQKVVFLKAVFKIDMVLQAAE